MPVSCAGCRSSASSRRSSCGHARAEVTRVEIARRADVGFSGYEKIVGTIHFAVDPKDPHNRMVVDLDKAPVNASGRVEFSSDLYILRPKAPRGNGAALVDILNRGNKVALNGFNRGGSPDPATENDLGDRFLMRFGYTLVWVGLGVRRAGPAAGDANSRASGRPIGGSDHRRRPRAWTANGGARRNSWSTDLASTTPVDPDGADSSLVACRAVPRDGMPR